MKKGLAVFSGSSVVHKLMQDGTVVLGSTSVNPALVTVSGNVDITGSLTASATRTEVGVVSPLTSSLLSDVFIELYNTGGANTTALSQSVSSSVADLQFQIDTLSGDIDLSGTLTTIAQIQDFLDGDASGTANIIENFNDISLGFNTLSASFVSSSVVLNGIDLNVQSNEALNIITGSTQNLEISTSGNNIIIDLQDNVSLSGYLSASSGLSVLNGATIGGGLTVSTGNALVSAGNLTVSGTGLFTGSLTTLSSLSVGTTATVTGVAQADSTAVTVSTGSLVVSHGTMQTLLVGGTDDTAISALYAASGSSNGRFFYLQGTAPVSTFPRANCWYFCQDGVWYDAPFIAEA